MFDGRKIVLGLVVFLVLVGSPIWYLMASGQVVSGQTTDPPALKIVTDAKQCIESVQYMRESHMELLANWREEVVRGGERTYTASDGQTYDKSTNTCFSCHPNKSEFCDQCHDYTNVKPDCWSCHVVPEDFQ